jgi:hypothetical protein
MSAPPAQLEATPGTVPDGPDPAGPAVGRRRLGPTAHPLAWYGISRLIVLLAAGVAIAVHSDVTPSRLASAWDAKWYLDIMRHGYPAVVPEVAGHAARTPLAFFPLFPLLARALAVVLHLPNTLAAVAVSTGFGATATVLFARFAARFTHERAARRATVLFCLFPGSAVFSVAYSESLMITLALACLLALLDRRWLAAGAAAALATATRPNAVGLVLACALAASVAIHRRREWRSLAAPLLAPTGLVAFLAYLWWRTGEPGVWFRVQREGWHQRFDFGVNTAKLVHNFVVDPGDGRLAVVFVLVAFTLAATAVYLGRRWPAPVTAYTLLVVVLALASTVDAARPRAILTAFPLFVGMGSVDSRRDHVVLAGLCAASLALLVLFPFWASP